MSRARLRRRSAMLDALLEELVAVSCDCSHPDHLLDVIRHRDDRRIRSLRLGPCMAPGCRCIGGRAA